MKIEVIILYVLQVLFVLLETYVAYLVLKYLKQKPLGMLTKLDKVARDTILSVLFDQILRVFLMGLIVEFARPLSDDMAFIITTLVHFFSVLFFKVGLFWICFNFFSSEKLVKTNLNKKY